MEGFKNKRPTTGKEGITNTLLAGVAFAGLTGSPEPARAQNIGTPAISPIEQRAELSTHHKDLFEILKKIGVTASPTQEQAKLLEVGGEAMMKLEGNHMTKDGVRNYAARVEGLTRNIRQLQQGIETASKSYEEQREMPGGGAFHKRQLDELHQALEKGIQEHSLVQKQLRDKHELAKKIEGMFKKIGIPVTYDPGQNIDQLLLPLLPNTEPTMPQTPPTSGGLPPLPGGEDPLKAINDSTNAARRGINGLR